MQICVFFERTCRSRLHFYAILRRQQQIRLLNRARKTAARTAMSAQPRLKHRVSRTKLSALLPHTVHGPNASPTLEVTAAHEFQGRARHSVRAVWVRRTGGAHGVTRSTGLSFRSSTPLVTHPIAPDRRSALRQIGCVYNLKYFATASPRECTCSLL